MKKRQRWQKFSHSGCAVWLTACIALGLIVSCAFQASPLQDGGRTAESSAETEADAEDAAATGGSDDGAAESADGTSTADDTEDGQHNEETELEEDEDVIEPDDWTFIVYMAADNNLESAAIADFNELERVVIPRGINILVLFDRRIGDDETNGNWTDTRLFEVCYDKDDTNTIVSERLDCPELGLSKTMATELDMANRDTLSALLAFAGRAYPAERYGLVMWGHGTGWRGDDAVLTETFGQAEVTRAFAIDSYSDSYMSIADLRIGIEAGLQKIPQVEKLSVIGFDTCYGICLETAYELRDCADLLMGTPALVPATGWNYTKLFSLFVSGERTALSFANCALEQYQAQYAQYAYASFSVVDCTQIAQVAASFNQFSAAAAALVTNTAKRKSVNALLQDACVNYRADSFPTDCYIDVKSTVTVLQAQYPSLASAAAVVSAATDAAILANWNSLARTDACGMGVFYAAFTMNGITDYSHAALYVNGSRQSGQCQFVIDCAAYVPTANAAGSLLDTLFYTQF